MIAHKLVEAFAFSTPVMCALVCMLMMLMDTRNMHDRRLHWYLALTYLVTALGWLGMVLYVVSPEGYISYHAVFLLALMLDQVMFYRLVALLTNTGETQNFNRLHVLIPFIITTLATVSDVLVPTEQKMSVMYGEINLAPDNWFGVAYIYTSVIFIIYNMLYPLLSLRNIVRYRRFIVNYSSDAQRTSLHWLFSMQLLILVCIPVPFAGLLLNIDTFASTWFVWLGALPYFVYYIILCYNMLDGNYLIVRRDPDDEYGLPVKTATLSREQFEQYLLDKKPFLDPKLRITDLAAGLNTNRTYLSAFISKEYEMNFSCLINHYRLLEIERLRQAPGYNSQKNMELVLSVGFGNYRNYLRVKKEEDKRSTLKVFNG